MDFSKDNQKKIARWVIGIAAVCILLYLGVQNIGTIAGAVSYAMGLVAPLLLGVFFALILNVPVRFFESHLFRKTKKERVKKLRRPLAIVLAIVVITAIVAGILCLVIPELIEAVKIIVQAATTLFDKLGNLDSPEAFEDIPFGEVLYENVFKNMTIDWDGIGSSLTTWVKEQSGTIMNTAVGTITSVVGAVVDFIIALIFSIYLLASKDKLKKQVTRIIKAWIPEKFSAWLIHATEVALRTFSRFVSGQTLEAIILGTLCMVGMLILQIPYAPTVGALVGVTAFIPVVGAFVGTAVGAFMILTVSPAKALIFVIFLLILQQIEGNLIYPKVMGDKVNLPAMWVLAAVTVGGGIGGAFGMLLGVPVTSTIYILVREATEKREQLKKEKEAVPVAEETEA